MFLKELTIDGSRRSAKYSRHVNRSNGAANHTCYWNCGRLQCSTSLSKAHMREVSRSDLVSVETTKTQDSDEQYMCDRQCLQTLKASLLAKVTDQHHRHQENKEEHSKHPLCIAK